jgi:hypothetical protein
MAAGYPRDAQEFEDTAERMARNQSFPSDSLMFDQRIASGKRLGTPQMI